LTMVGMLFDWGANNEWGPDGKPKFCGSLECPLYKVMRKTKTFELRCYPELKWVSTNGVNTGSWNVGKQPFMRLFKYISGENSEKEKIDMTAPVTMKHAMIKDVVSSKYTMSFYITSEKPPTPDNPLVRITTTPKTCYYVHSFGGFANSERNQKQLNVLMAELKKLGITFNQSAMWTAGYDSPWKLLNRHNEVWVKA